ncbi:arsenate-mycothiol transferase ArsC [Membranihabitans maritimus]|uniref:arsenate-mycothiol transferase ArsC n=1 Tax=Membranihabitans maritimus TaxID=2904244 RepID=UPI001F37485E|nr:protein-tyrosine-phosphatase [Membranihabitans maritimus]
MKNTLFPGVKEIIQSLDTTAITDERKATLDVFVRHIQNKLKDQNLVRLNFICTHNSRRSHLSQVWAQTLAHYYGIANILCYSGGTEETALFPRVSETLTALGFQIQTLSEGKNPVYSIKYAENAYPVIGFSKTFDHPFNPKSGFAAVMTCSHADENCPFIPGADVRIPLTFEDPKAFDNSPLQAEKYMERSLQIATELKYIFSNVKK